jgi:hypothetical protein
MVIVILLSVITFFFVGRYIWLNSYDFIDYFIATVFMTIIGSLVGIGLASLLPMDTITKVDTYNIVSLKDNNSVSGNFLLCSGSINGEMKYTFYYEENGFYKMKQIDIDNTSIKYSDDIKVERYREEATVLHLYLNIDENLC